jgi:hypothetical protein
MAAEADSATLDRQPRQRRTVYHALAKAPTGRSVKDLLGDTGVPEVELRENLRKLEAAGLALRIKGVWNAVAVDVDEARRA